MDPLRRRTAIGASSDTTFKMRFEPHHLSALKGRHPSAPGTAGGQANYLFFMRHSGFTSKKNSRWRIILHYFLNEIWPYHLLALKAVQSF
jgi:hypothetical protein